MNIKTEIWNEHKIRFVEKEAGEWWAVAADVCAALEYSNPWDALANHCPDLAKSEAWVQTGICKDGTPAMRKTEINIINEIDIYSLIFGAASQGKSESVRKKANEFKRWVFGVIKQLRQAAGLEGFQVFRMLDKEHQREAMKRLHDGLRDPVRVDYMKANTITNKAVSTMFGHARMIKKEQMTPDMLIKRQSILDDTVNLMAVSESFGLGLHISGMVYAKYN